MLLERFVEHDKKIMVLKPSEQTPLHTIFEKSIFLATKSTCDEYRLNLPRKTVYFQQDATVESLERTYQLLTPEEYRKLEHDIVPFSREGWSNEDEEELHSFLFDLALLTKNIPWANELYKQFH